MNREKSSFTSILLKTSSSKTVGISGNNCVALKTCNLEVASKRGDSSQQTCASTDQSSCPSASSTPTSSSTTYSHFAAKKKPTESAGDSILIVKSAPKIYQVCKSIPRTGLSSAVTSSSSIMSTAVEGGDVVNESDSQVASLTKIPTVTQVKVESKEDIQGSETQQNGNSSQSTQDCETRSASPFTKLESSTEPLEAVQVEFDPSSIMTWTDGVGSLPGSELQFKLDDSGNLEMIDDEEANNIRKEHQERRARGLPDPVVVAKPLAAAKIVEEENKEPNVAPMKRKKCANCGKVGDGSRFVRAGKFCSQDCATSQANQLRMMASAASSVRPGASLISRSDSSSASKPKSLLFDNNHHSKGRHTDNGSRSSSPGTKAKRHKSDSDHGHENDRRKSSETSSSFIPKKDAIGMKGVFARMKNRFDLNDRNSNNDSLPSSPSSSLVNITPQSALQQSIFSMRVMQHQQAPPIAWDKHSANLRPLLKDIRPLEVLKWLPDQVSSFVNSIPGCQEIGQTFSDELIDGEAFLLLNQQDIVKVLNIKLGPAVKIYNSIILIRDAMEASQ